MKKLVLLAFLGIVNTLPAFAQRDIDVYESDRRYCASGRSGVDFNSCMWRLQNDRRRYERREYYEPRPQWGEPPPRYVEPGWQPDPYAPRWQAPREREREREQPRLSDMQKRALENCALLQPRDQPRCRATVYSTVNN